MRIIHVVGARPNFMKAAPVIEALAQHGGLEQTLVHTGQHYDHNMSQIFFKELGLPLPDHNLEVGSGSQAWQTAQIMQRFEPLTGSLEPDWLFVYGDVNSTLACALVCVKLGIPVAHVEAGLRSFDRSMPEEINRVLVDQVSELLFTPSRGAQVNLANEGVARERICFVGNVMIDTLIRLLPRALERQKEVMGRLALDRYLLVTLHRPSNVDHPRRLREVLAALNRTPESVKVVFPVHPRTKRMLEESGLQNQFSRLHFIEPVGYLDFLALQSGARLVVTDSGGVQEETTFLGVPCLTMRPNTERPITVEKGTNFLVPEHPKALGELVESRLQERRSKRPELEKWDGKAAGRIASDFVRLAVDRDVPGNA